MNREQTLLCSAATVLSQLKTIVRRRSNIAMSSKSLRATWWRSDNSALSTRSREGWPKPMNICNAPGCSSRKNNTVLLKLGATFSAVGSYGEARDAATQILARQPDDEQALLLLTDAVRAPGEVEETRQRIEALRQRTETAPDTI